MEVTSVSKKAKRTEPKLNANATGHAKSGVFTDISRGFTIAG